MINLNRMVCSVLSGGSADYTRTSKAERIGPKPFTFLPYSVGVNPLRSYCTAKPDHWSESGTQ